MPQTAFPLLIPHQPCCGTPSFNTIYTNQEVVLSLQNPLKPLISPIEIKLQLPRLLRTQLLRRSHLIERNQPLHDLPFILEISIRNSIHRLYRFN